MISRGAPVRGLVEQKICIVTGGAQGFGEGIAGSLVRDGANVVIADLNEEAGRANGTESMRTSGKMMSFL